MHGIFPNPEQFIRDLSKVSATLDRPPKIERFLSDLDKLHRYVAAAPRPVPVAPAHCHAELAKLFDEIRTGAIKRLGGPKWVESLPANDPLLCQVGLFGTLDLGLRETAHTRALAWLLDPRETHGFGETLLGALLKQIFPPNGDRRLFEVHVHSEFKCRGGQDRLDISMSGKWSLPGGKTETWLVVVEAKIEADEGEEQLARYDDQLIKQIADSDRHALIFLTPDDRNPTSASKDGKATWETLTFIKLMAVFRQELPLLIGKPGLDFLRLYMTGVLKDIYRLDCGHFGGRNPDTDEIYHICDYLSRETIGGK